MSASNGVLLTVNELTISYGNIRAVKGISFEVHEGEIVTLIGANGAGKSSTLRAISGLVPYKGEVIYRGQNLHDIPADQIVALGIAQVPEGRGIFGNLTVGENLKLATWQRKDKAEIARDYERVFGIFPRLKERINQLGGTLSGGEQQMLAVARALMSRGRMLLLDEPSMGLAPVLVREIFKVLQEINQSGVTILLVEQNANMALRVAHRGYVLETGLITLSGPGKELLVDQRVKEAYLGG
ncbi:MAG: ABC transporter ATP-binding protein [Anaerolineales bacterium]|jgi:branched-chain amino acid transport system ATP-binding protein|nr:ABC transporter ATP-binding protein [Anaerolineales bacterium]